MIINADFFVSFFFTQNFLERKCLVEFNFQHFNVRTQLNVVTSAVTGGEK